MAKSFKSRGNKIGLAYDPIRVFVDDDNYNNYISVDSDKDSAN